MVSPDVSGQSPERSSRRRPFTTWVKRLASLKSSDVKSGTQSKAKKLDAARAKNNPYPESGHAQTKPTTSAGGHDGVHSYRSNGTSRANSASIVSTTDDNDNDIDVANDAATYSNKSNAPTVETNPDTVHSDAGHSRAFTTKTGGAVSSMDGAAVNSTFSSPNQSEHSLTTTLTTIHSTSPGVVLGNQSHGGTSQGPSNPVSGHNSVTFSHQFPSLGPASALPPHLAPSGHPSTYSAATANNLLTDDASILTLASSSKRRRRRSMDTDASVRALAPSSVWGGSRESLPLSVLSSNADMAPLPGSGYAAQPGRPAVGNIASAERASVYSSHSVAAPALVSDRNSYYATSLKQSIRDKERDRDARSIDGRSLYRDADDQRSLHGGKSIHDGAKGYESSIKSGALGHNRNDSNAGSVTAPLASPGAVPATVPVRPTEANSRRGSAQPIEAVNGVDGEL